MQGVLNKIQLHRHARVTEHAAEGTACPIITFPLWQLMPCLPDTHTTPLPAVMLERMGPTNTHSPDTCLRALTPNGLEPQLRPCRSDRGCAKSAQAMG